MTTPDRSEAAPYYFMYIDLVQGDALDAMRAQTRAVLADLRAIAPEQSRARYAPRKWSIREVLGHLNDTEPGSFRHGVNRCRPFAETTVWSAPPHSRKTRRRRTTSASVKGPPPAGIREKHGGGPTPAGLGDDEPSTRFSGARNPVVGANGLHRHARFMK